LIAVSSCYSIRPTEVKRRHQRGFCAASKNRTEPQLRFTHISRFGFNCIFIRGVQVMAFSQKLFPRKKEDHETYHSNENVKRILRRGAVINGRALPTNRRSKSQSDTTSSAYTGVSFGHGGQR